MPQLKNMKLKVERPVMAESPEEPVYPYGLSISLSNESIDKLGLEMPKVSDTAEMIAKVEVTNISKHEGSDGSVEKNIRLQITDMAFLEPEKTNKEIFFG